MSTSTNTARETAKEEVKRRTDIVAEIRKRGVALHRAGDDFEGFCPFHEDHTTPNLKVNARDQYYKCFACEAKGDVIDFIQRKEKIAFVDVLRDLAQQAGVELPHEKKDTNSTVRRVTPLDELSEATIEHLASVKKIPIEALSALDWCNTKRNSKRAIRIPYANEQGEVITVRYRTAIRKGEGRDNRFIWPKRARTMLYGLQRLEAIRKKGYVLLVEGETDTALLTYLGIPALGVPGKQNWKREWAPLLEGLEVYAWQEPGAEDFIEKIARDIPGLKVIDPPAGMKDVCEMHAAGRDVKAYIAAQTKTARPASDLLAAKQAETIRELLELSAPILNSADPLDEVRAAIGRLGYGGDTKHVELTYLAATSRVLSVRSGAMLVHILLLGPPSSGKSHTINTVRVLLPPDAYHVIDAGSPRALIYDSSDLQHKWLVFAEADSLPAGEDNSAASAIRNLLQDGHLHYTVTIRHPETGDWTVREVEKPGPTALATTAVRRLGEQLESRLFVLDVPDGQEQVRAALRAQAHIELSGSVQPPEALIAYQALLQARAPWDVSVPFAGKLAEEIGKAPINTRINRDFMRLLALLKAVAVLRFGQRGRDAKGNLIATLDDYRAVYGLVKDVYKASVSGASENVHKVVDAVKELREPGRAPNSDVTGHVTERVTNARVAKKSGLTTMQASRAVATAEAGGWIVNKSEQKNAKDLDLGEPLPNETGLPTPETLAAVIGEGSYNGVTEQTGRYIPSNETAHSNGHSASERLIHTTVNDVTPLHASVNGNGKHAIEEDDNAAFLGGKVSWASINFEDDDDDDIPF